jgi:hypothetical protein
MIALLFTLMAVLIQGAAEQRGSASVEGVVLRSGSTEPVSRARVLLTPGDGATGRDIEATTSGDGRFVLQNVPPGKYRLTAARDGGAYAPSDYGQRHAKGRGLSFTIAAGEQMKDVELAMAPTGSISGRIVDGNGNPVPDARVMALEAVYNEGRRELRMGQAVRSNDLGEYRLFWLPAGRYYVGVQPIDSRIRRACGLAGSLGTTRRCDKPCRHSPHHG